MNSKEKEDKKGGTKELKLSLNERKKSVNVGKKTKKETEKQAKI